ncbi:MAG: T9SS type A sorting domain-containing protein [Saprospiraceae bacterium]
MKKIILTSLLFLFLFQIGKSQQEPLLKKYIESFKYSSADTFTVVHEIFYNYDQFNNLIFEESKEYTNSGSLWKQKGISYEYYPNHLLKRKNFRRFNSDVDLFITEDYIEYKYDDNNCLVEEIFFENIGGKLTKKNIYTPNENCRWDFKYVYFRSGSTNTNLRLGYHLERIYFPDEISYEERLIGHTFSGDSTYMEEWNVQIFDEHENLVEQIYVDSQAYHGGYREDKYVIAYDIFNHRTSRTVYERTFDTVDLDLKYIFSHNNNYDENGSLTKRVNELVSYSTGVPIINSNYSNIETIKNTCEGIVELIDILHESGYREREQFIYEGKNDCIDLNKIYLSMRVFPNPSDGFFEIFSPIFQTGNTEIIVYSIDGKALLQKAENNRSRFSMLDLSFLQNGFYILELRNGDHFVKEKIVIAK